MDYHVWPSLNIDHRHASVVRVGHPLPDLAHARPSHAPLVSLTGTHGAHDAIPERRVVLTSARIAHLVRREEQAGADAAIFRQEFHQDLICKGLDHSQHLPFVPRRAVHRWPNRFKIGTMRAKCLG
ncbi:MAG TPA: hypothetical protein VHI13_08800, partial [Candidatus Kapabacteria bacterium]|nr:hypothetical protein [Candidatus Kapabacteria bacterium]